MRTAIAEQLALLRVSEGLLMLANLSEQTVHNNEELSDTITCLDTSYKVLSIFMGLQGTTKGTRREVREEGRTTHMSHNLCHIVTIH